MPGAAVVGTADLHGGRLEPEEAADASETESDASSSVFIDLDSPFPLPGGFTYSRVRAGLPFLPFA